MSVYEFLSVDIDTDIDAKTSISGGKDCRFGSSYPISTFFTSISKHDVDIDFDIGWQGLSFWIIVPDIDVFLSQYRRKTSISTFL